MPAIPTSDLPGHQAVHDRVNAALDTRVETQSVDFKRSATWVDLQFTLVKTAMAMGNLRDGGVVIIGADESGDQWLVTGISDADLATYDFDTVAAAMAKYSSPTLTVELVLVAYQSTRVLAMNVREFVDSPFVCAKDGPPGSGLRQGTLYLRPPGVPRTSEVRAAHEMHDLLELAAEKRARRILETAARIGMKAPATDAKRFDDELGEL